MTTRKYTSLSQQTTLTTPVTSGATILPVVSAAALVPTTIAANEVFTVVIDPDTSLEEIVDIVSSSGNPISANNLTVVRGVDGSSAQAHSAGAVIRHMIIGRDLRESNTHAESTATAHGLTMSNVIQTTDSARVTGTMIAGLTITDANISNSAAIANAKLATNPLDRANHTGTQLASTVSNFDTQVRTSRLDQMAAPTASVAMNSQKITGLATPTANTDAATKAYADGLITTLVASAPTTLDTLNELAVALGNDANFATTTATALAGKLPLAGGTMTGAIAMGSNKITGLGAPTVGTDAVTKTYVDSTLVLAPGNLTGPITSVGAATAIASQTGTGTTFVMNTSPTLVTPTLGAATATTINSTVIPTSATLVKTTDTLAVHAATTSLQLAGVISDETGSGALVFANTPTLVTPVIGAATGTSLALTGDLTSTNAGSFTSLKDFETLALMGAL